MQWGVDPIEPAELLLLLQRQLQEGGTPTGSNLPGAALADLAFLCSWPDDELLKNPRGKQFVAIRPGRFPLWQSVVTGAGGPLLVPGRGPASPPVAGTPATTSPSATGFNPVVGLSCFAQINADPETRSAQALAEATLGVVSFVWRVFRAVQFWTPCTNANLTNCYLREPARVSDGGFGLTPKRVGDGWWVHAPMDLELRFTAA